MLGVPPDSRRLSSGPRCVAGRQLFPLWPSLCLCPAVPDPDCHRCIPSPVVPSFAYSFVSAMGRRVFNPNVNWSRSVRVGRFRSFSCRCYFFFFFLLFLCSMIRYNVDALDMYEHVRICVCVCVCVYVWIVCACVCVSEWVWVKTKEYLNTNRMQSSLRSSYSAVT